MFVATSNSNLPLIGNAGTDFGAEISAGHLEMSNVDLSQEFTDMIITQRGFQANARIITTSDEIIRDMISLKQ
jgi:flagellar hook protein FlgE